MKSVFKSKLIEARAKYLAPELLAILIEMVDWCTEQKITPLITETVTTHEEDVVLKRVSDTHQQGRAFDISTHDWSPEHIEAFITLFTRKYGYMGAISPKTETPALIIHHNAGTGPHCHVQLSRKYTRFVKQMLSEDLTEQETA